MLRTGEEHVFGFQLALNPQGRCASDLLHQQRLGYILCPDGETCAKDGAARAVPEEDWENTYGVKQIATVFA